MRTRCSAFLLALGVMSLLGLAYAQSFTGSPQVRTTPNSATVVWNTNTPSNSRVMYGTNQNNLTELAESPGGSAHHEVTISNLQPGTTYYFQAESGEAESCGVRQFQTATTAQGQVALHVAPVVVKCTPGAEQNKVKITNGPVIETADAHNATVAWSTNVKGSTRVMYGTDPNNLTQLAEAPWGQGGLTHRVTMRNLQPNTTYYFEVETGQAQGLAGAEVESNKKLSFKTPAEGAAPLHNVSVQ